MLFTYFGAVAKMGFRQFFWMCCRFYGLQTSKALELYSYSHVVRNCLDEFVTHSSSQDFKFLLPQQAKYYCWLLLLSLPILSKGHISSFFLKSLKRGLCAAAFDAN